MPQILGKAVGSIGYGLMGLTWRPQPPSEEQAFKAMRAALAAGCNYWNGAEFYGTEELNSLTLLNKYFTKYPEDAEKVVLSVKGAIHLPSLVPDCSPEFIRQSMDNVLRLLDGKKKVDVFAPARIDKKVPIETWLRVLDEEYVKTGKLGGISLSECSAATIQKAAEITTIAAVELELSLWATQVLENGSAQVCAKYGIPITAYSPIGRGMLTGDIKSPDDIPENDFRRTVPRFQGENFKTNLKLVDALKNIASRKGCTPAQLAISWVSNLSEKDGNPVIIPLPGAVTEARVKENSTHIALSKNDVAEIASILSQFPVTGARYGGHAAAVMEG